MARFITIPIKSNTPETFKVKDKYEEELKTTRAMNLSTEKIEKAWEEEALETFTFKNSDINVDMIVGIHDDIDNSENIVIKTVLRDIITNKTREELKEIILTQTWG